MRKSGYKLFWGKYPSVGKIEINFPLIVMEQQKMKKEKSKRITISPVLPSLRIKSQQWAQFLSFWGNSLHRSER
jgi:hypothetical protein